MALGLTELFPDMSTVNMLMNIDGALRVAQAAMSFYAKNVVIKIEGIVKACLSMYVIWYGLALMRGEIKEVMTDAHIRVFKIALVIMLSMSSAKYNSIISSFFWQMPENLVKLLIPGNVITQLTSIVVKGPAGTDLSLLLISTVMSATTSLMQSSLSASSMAGQTDPGLFAAGMGVGVAGASVTAVVAGILLVAKISLSVLLALGPFFLLAILSEKTKSYFDGWLSQVLNFVLVILLLTLTIYILFPLMIVTVSSYYLIAHFANGVLTLRESVELITLLAIFLAVIKQVPTTAAAVVRGYAVGALQERGLMGSSGSAAGGKPANQVQAEVNTANTRR